MIASMMGGLDWASKSAWGNGIEKWAIRPSAQAFLTFAFYGPGNIAEMYLKSTLAGIPPALPWTPWSGFFGGKMVPRQQLAYMLKNMPPELLPTELLGMPPSNFFDPSFTWTPQTGFVKDSNWVTELLTFDWVSNIGSWAKYVNPYRVMVAVPGHITQNMQAHYLTQTMRRELVQNNGEVVSKLVNAWTKHEGLLETVPKNLRKLFESLANTNIMVDKGTFRQTIEQMIANKGSITVDNVIENGKHYNLPIGFTQQVKSDYSTGKIFKQSLKDYTDQLYEVYRKLEVTKPESQIPRWQARIDDMKGIQPRTREEYLNKFYEFDNMVKVYNAYLLQQKGQIHKLARSYSNDLRSQLYRSHRIGINRFEKEIGNGIIEVGQQLQHVGDNVSMESLRALRKMTSVRRGLGNRESFGRITDLFFKLPLGVKTVLTSEGIGPKIKWQSADNNTLLGQVWQEYFLRSLKLGDTSAIDEYLRATGREFEASYLKVTLQRIPPPPTGCWC